MNRLLRPGFFLIAVIGNFFCFGQTEKWQAQWIGIPVAEKDTNLWTAYRKEFSLNAIPKRAATKIATDSKYWLWVNGKLSVFEGELKRGPTPRDTYYDEIDLAPYLVKGKNTIAILTWYWGRDGFNHKNSGRPALLFEASIGEKKIITDTSWVAIRHPAFGHTDAPVPNYRLAEFNIHFDAQKDIASWTQPGFDARNWTTVEEYGLPPVAPWNQLFPRPIPMWKDGGLQDYVNKTDAPAESDGHLIVMRLPKNLTITPYLKILAPAGLKIDLQTDNYKGGSEYNVRSEYITKEGIQEFESLGYMNGHELWYRIPPGVKILSLKYRETRYNTERTGSFYCNDSFYNKLWEKSFNTLNVNLRDAIQDPDRERAQWWGDAVILMGEILYSCDQNGLPAIQKAIRNLVDWQKEDGVLYSPVPAGSWDRELPAQMLAAVGNYGFWNYYRYTGDSALIRYVYPAVKKYLYLWQMGDNGLVVHRPGGWDWLDWGEHIDVPLLDNAWYYMALQSADGMARLAGHPEDTLAYQNRITSIRANYDKNFWTGSCYRSPENKGPIDDRGNGLAVVAGLAGPEKFDPIKRVLAAEFHASPYMEKYILESFFLMHDATAGLARMKHRYAKMVESNLTTLWEGWGIGSEGYGGGSYNHGWSGGPLTLLSQYAAGIAPDTPAYKTFRILPQPGDLKEIHCIVPTVKGKINVNWLKLDQGRQQLIVTVPPGTVATIGIPGPVSPGSNIFVNGKRIPENEPSTQPNAERNTIDADDDPLPGMPRNIKYTGTDTHYFLFTAKPGKWDFTLVSPDDKTNVFTIKNREDK